MSRDLPTALRRAAPALVLAVLALVLSLPANEDLESLLRIVAAILVVLALLLGAGTLYRRDEDASVRR